MAENKTQGDRSAKDAALHEPAAPSSEQSAHQSSSRERMDERTNQLINESGAISEGRPDQSERK